jgi:hypothetical protein
VFLFRQNHFSLGEKGIVAGFISLWVVNSGVLFENYRWVVTSEWIRIVLYTILLAAATWTLQWNPVYYLIASSYLVVSSVWFYLIRRASNPIS